MEKHSGYSLIQIGLWVRHLQGAERLTLKSVRLGINIILPEFDKFQLNVSKSGSMQLKTFMDNLSSIDDDETLGNDRAKELSDLMLTLEHIIFAESKIKYYYVTTDKKHNTVYLMDQPEKLFRDGVFKRLSQLSQDDFIEGFKCITFEIPTAAAFHILRATEGVLKDCYFSNVKQNRVKKPMWGNMLKQLKERKRNRLPGALLGCLDNIRESYRNPTNHPEAVYNIDQAEDLLGLCVDVTNKMDNHRQKLPNKSLKRTAPPPLSSSVSRMTFNKQP